MSTYKRKMRGIPLWLLREYLEEIGGESQGKTRVTGNGWTADLKQVEDFTVGSLTVGQVVLEVNADEDAWELLQPVLGQPLVDTVDIRQITQEDTTARFFLSEITL